MKHLSIIVSFFITLNTMAQENLLESKVYNWNDNSVCIKGPVAIHPIVQGKTIDLEMFEASAVSLYQVSKSKQTISSDTCETIIMVKEGELKTNLAGKQKNLVPGSIVWMMPGEKCTVSNNGKTTASYLLINMNSRNATKLQRGKDAGGSFIIDFKEQEFKSHDKGGIRNYFRDRSSAMFGFTEMHVTTLNPQIKSHEPHTHRAAEMVIMLSGDTEMQIGDQFYKAQTGDFYFLDSNVSHAIRNTGNEACMYLAFQWE